MDSEVIEFLKSRIGADEPARVRTYRLYINSREVVVNVYDHGPGTGSLRYAVEAYLAELTREERMGGTRGYTFGNPDSTLKGALLEAHWNEFN